MCKTPAGSDVRCSRGGDVLQTPQGATRALVVTTGASPWLWLLQYTTLLHRDRRQQLPLLSTELHGVRTPRPLSTRWTWTTRASESGRVDCWSPRRRGEATTACTCGRSGERVDSASLWHQGDSADHKSDQFSTDAVTAPALSVRR